MRRCNCCEQKKPATAFYRSYRTQCKDCLKAKAAPKRAEKLKYLREWREANPQAHKHWYQKNRARKSEYWKDWYERNKEHRSESYAQWARKNKHIINAIVAKRTAAKKLAMVAWADDVAIRRMYRLAAELTANTGIKHEVDHVIPIQGENVCGLHWEGNLQILTKTENIRKSNRLLESIAC